MAGLSGAFYSAPEPAQQAPRVPISTGGDQPPRRLTGAFATAAALAWAPLAWSAQTGPASIPRTYGQQPPNVGTEAPIALLTPTPDWSAQGGSRIAPLTLPAGQQPPRFEWRVAPTIRTSWIVDWGAQSSAVSAAWNVPPPVSAFIPFRRDPVPMVFPDWAVQSEEYAAPLTLVYGQPPPGVRPRDLAYVLPWSVDWTAQSEAETAAWNIPVVSPFVPSRRAGILWLPDDWRPPVLGQAALWSTGTDFAGGWPLALGISLTVPWPALEWRGQAAAPVAPLTLIYGQQPAPIGTAAPDALTWPPFDWATQRLTPTSAWNIPIVSVHQAPPPFPLIVLAGGPDWRAQWAKAIAPQTLPIGQQPLAWSWRTGPTILRTWELDWAAQGGAQIVPLTLVYGQRPPPIGPVAVEELTALLSWPWDYAQPVRLLPIAQFFPHAVLNIALSVIDRSGVRYVIIDSSLIRYRVSDASGPRYRESDGDT